MSNRIDSLDAIRGAAIAVILLVHLNVYGSGSLVLVWPSPVDGAMATGLLWFGFGKLYGLFALLFGMGAAFLYHRGRGYWARRMLFLLVVGAVHLAIWRGDILLGYGVIGLAMLAVWGGRRRLLVLAGLLLAWPTLIYLSYSWMAANDLLTFGGGGGWSLSWSIMTWWPQVAAMMLVGLWAGRVKVWDWEWGGARLAVVGLGVGIPLCGFDALNRLNDPAIMFAGRAAAVYGGAFLSVGYFGLGLLFWQRLPGLDWLKAIGRTALTCYLLQTAFMVVIFDVLRLDLRPIATIPLFVGFTAVLAYSARLWLAEWGGGPVELVWRRWSGGKMGAAVSVKGV